jgi:iron complex outermembrane receptor protein
LPLPHRFGARHWTSLFALLSFCALLCPLTPAHAEEAPPPIERPRLLKKLSLDQLFDLEVTSVSQKPESLSKTAAAIHVVTQSDLHQMGAVSIPEALRDIPGVEVARVDSRQYAITARGFNGTIANKLLVLIDGRSVYTPLYSGVFWDAQDTFMEDIEQIEVIRGPGATVWGSNAVNGVINVRTKSAAETQGWLLSGGGGSAERGFGEARYGGMLSRNASYRIYGKHFDRESSFHPDGTEAGDDWRMTQGGFRVDWDPKGTDRLTVQGDAYTGSEDQPNSAATDLKGGNALARWTRRFSPRSDLELRGYYDRTERLSSVFSEILDTYDLELQHRFAPGPRQDVIWGLGYRLMRDDVGNSPALAFLPANIAHELFSGFVQDELELMADRVRLTLGSKIEHNSYTGFEFQPSARLAWTPVVTQTVWAAASRAVRTPSRIDRDFFVPGTPPYFLAGNPNFESEVLNAFELGYKTNPTAQLTGSVSTFYNLYDDLRSVELTGLPILLGNGMKAHTYGLETEGSWQATAPWRLSAGYSYLKLKLEAKPGSTDMTSHLQSGDSPQHQVFLRSSMAIAPRLALDVTSRYVGNLPNQQVPAYATADARLGWQASDKAEIEVVGQNLFDPRHPEFGPPATRREIARGFYGRLTCRF